MNIYITNSKLIFRKKELEEYVTAIFDMNVVANTSNKLNTLLRCGTNDRVGGVILAGGEIVKGISLNDGRTYYFGFITNNTKEDYYVEVNQTDFDLKLSYNDSEAYNDGTVKIEIRYYMGDKSLGYDYGYNLLKNVNREVGKSVSIDGNYANTNDEKDLLYKNIPVYGDATYIFNICKQHSTNPARIVEFDSNGNVVNVVTFVNYQMKIKFTTNSNTHAISIYYKYLTASDNVEDGFTHLRRIE